MTPMLEAIGTCATVAEATRLRGQESVCLAATQDGKVVGTVVLWRKPGAIWMQLALGETRRDLRCAGEIALDALIGPCKIDRVSVVPGGSDEA